MSCCARRAIEGLLLTPFAFLHGVIVSAPRMIVDINQADCNLFRDAPSDRNLGDAEGYSTSYMDPYGAMRTSNPMYRDPEESERPALSPSDCS